MSQGPAPAGGSVRPAVAWAFAVMGFVALALFALGMTSLATNEDVITVPGGVQLPGIVGMSLAAVVFAAGLWVAIRPRHPSFWSTLGVTAGAFLGYLVGAWFGALIGGVDLAAATTAVGRVAVSWFGLALALAAFVAAWAGVALVRTRAGRPRWPWEGHDEE